MCSQLSRISGICANQIEQLILQSPIGDQYERGQISSEDMLRHFNTQFNTNLPLEDFLWAISDIFKLNKDIMPLLERLRKNGVELIILSNTCQAHIDYIRKNFSILDKFDKHIFSYEIGSRKPEKKIFFSALKNSSSEISNCFYTDDIEEYIKTASELGIDSHQYISLDKLTFALQSKGFI